MDLRQREVRIHSRNRRGIPATMSDNLIPNPDYWKAKYEILYVKLADPSQYMTGPRYNTLQDAIEQKNAIPSHIPETPCPK